jgi:hypothetical protein
MNNVIVFSKQPPPKLYSGEKPQYINLMLFLWLKNSEWKRGKYGIGG